MVSCCNKQIRYPIPFYWKILTKQEQWKIWDPIAEETKDYGNIFCESGKDAFERRCLECAVKAGLVW